MSLLKNYLSGYSSLDHVVQEVKQLFQGHEDLIQDFICFLPPETRSSAIGLIQSSPVEAMPTNMSSLPMPYQPSYYSVVPPLLSSTVSPLIYQSVYAPQSYSSLPVLQGIPLSSQEELETLPKQSPKRSRIDDHIQLQQSDTHSLDSLRTLGGKRKYHNFVKICQLFNKVY